MLVHGEVSEPAFALPMFRATASWRASLRGADGQVECTRGLALPGGSWMVLRHPTPPQKPQTVLTCKAYNEKGERMDRERAADISTPD